MTWFVHALQSHPELALFLTLAIGYAVGKVQIGSFKVGSVTGVLITGVIIGQLNITIDATVKSVFFLLFLFALGYNAGPQFFKGLPNYKDQYYNGNREVSNQDFLGVVLSNDNGLITLEQRNYFKKGTIVEFISPNFEETEYTIEDIYDEDMNLIEEANHAQMIVKFKTDLSE